MIVISETECYSCNGVLARPPNCGSDCDLVADLEYCGEMLDLSVNTPPTAVCDGICMVGWPLLLIHSINKITPNIISTIKLIFAIGFLFGSSNVSKFCLELFSFNTWDRRLWTIITCSYFGDGIHRSFWGRN